MSSGERLGWRKAGTYLSLPGTRGRYLSTFTMHPTVKWGKQGRGPRSQLPPRRLRAAEKAGALSLFPSVSRPLAISNTYTTKPSSPNPSNVGPSPTQPLS